MGVVRAYTHPVTPDDSFRGLRGLQAQHDAAQQIAGEVSRIQEAKRAEEQSRHDEVVQATTSLADLLDDVAAATGRVDGSVRHVEDAVRHVETAVGGMRDEVSAAVRDVEQAVGQMRVDVREALGEVTTAVNDMNAATSRLMWVSIIVASLAIIATILTTIF